LLIAGASAEECYDSFEWCPSYESLCESEGAIGNYLKSSCEETCGVCGDTSKTREPLPPHVGGCGTPDVQSITRVIGGKDATRGSWPWQILLQYQGQGMCGGALVSPEWVVTAAHCVYGREEETDVHSIVVGEHDRTKREGSEATYQVDKIISHENYDQEAMNNDIAMIKLSKPVSFNKFVSPICLPKHKRNIPVGSKCFITGFGKIRHPGTMTPILQEAILPVVSNKVCYEKNSEVIDIPITRGMLCGGSGGSSIKSGCHGDSGGPYVCKVKGKWELHGAVSWGSPECKSSQTYTVFTRVTHFLDWIKTNLEYNG